MTLIAKITEPRSTVYTNSVYQHDRNVTLVIEGIDLTDNYEVFFSDRKEGSISVSVPGKAEGVVVPDALLSTGEYIYAWVIEPDESAGKETLCMVTIPVIPRPVPIPVNGSSSGGGSIKYEVDPDEENLIFKGTAVNRSLTPNIEEEN